MTRAVNAARNRIDMRSDASMNETLAIAGSGAIACGLAASAAPHGDVRLWARSDASVARARAKVDSLCEKIDDADPTRVEVVADLDALSTSTFVVEAITEELEAKTDLLGLLGPDRQARRGAGDDDIVAAGRRARDRERRPRTFRRPARLQPGTADEARRAGVRRPRRPRTSATARARCATTSARPPSRSPTSRASSSTGCCSRTCSAPSTCSRRRAWTRRRSTPR